MEYAPAAAAAAAAAARRRLRGVEARELPVAAQRHDQRGEVGGELQARVEQRRHRAWLVLNLQRPHDVARSHHLRRVKRRRHDAQATRLRFVRPVVL